MPTPALGAGYKHERSAGGASLGGFVAQISLSLPLWDRRGGAVQAADAEAERRQADIETLHRRTEREVRDAYESSQALAPSHRGRLTRRRGNVDRAISLF